MNTLLSLLAIDDVAQRTGSGLNPALRAAIEAQARFPSRAASPFPQDPIDPTSLPEGVTPLRTSAVTREKKTA